MSNGSERFNEKDLLAKGFVPDGNGGYVKQSENSRVDFRLKDNAIKFLQENPNTLQLVQKQIAEKFPAKGKFSKVKKDAHGMNKTESAYALHLDAMKRDGQIHDFWFESVTIKLAPDCRLTPDFMIQHNDGSLVFHDVKGSKFIYQDDAKVKMKVAEHSMPFKFFAVFPIPQKQGGGWNVQPVSNHY